MDETDEQFTERMAAKGKLLSSPTYTGTEPTIPLQAMTPETDEQFTARMAAKAKAVGSNGPNGVPIPPPTPYQVTIHNEVTVPWNQFVTSDLGIGANEIKRTLIGAEMQGGEYSYEDGMAELEKLKLADEQERGKIKQWEATYPNLRGLQFAGPALEMLPTLAELAGAYGVGAAAGAGTGAVMGAVFAAPTAEVAAPVTVPSTAAVMAALGGDAAVFTAMAYHGGGGAYLKAREMGYDHQQAVNWSWPIAAVSGLIGSMRTKQLTGAAAAAYAHALKTAGGPKLIAHAMGQYAKSVGLQVGLSTAQEEFNILMEIAGNLMTGKGKQIPTGDEIVARLDAAIKKAAQAAVVLAGATHGASEAVGAIARKAEAKKPPHAPKTILETLNAIEQITREPDKTEFDHPTETKVEGRIIKEDKADEAPTWEGLKAYAQELGKESKKIVDGIKAKSEDKPESSWEDLASYAKDLGEKSKVLVAGIEERSKLDLKLEAEKKRLAEEKQAEKDAAKAERDAFKEKEKARAEREKMLAEETLKAVQGDTPVELNPDKSKKNVNRFQKMNNHPNKLVRMAAKLDYSNLLASIATFNQKLRIAFKDTAPEARKAIMDLLDMSKATTRVETLINEQMNILLHELEKSTGLSENEVVSLFVKMSQNTIRDTWIDKDGLPVEYEKTKAESLDILLNMQEENTNRGLKNGNGFSGESMGDTGPLTTEAMIRRNLTEPELKLIEGYQNYYKQMYKKLAAAYKDETGKDLPEIKNYSGYIRRRRQSAEQADMEDILTASLQGLVDFESLPNSKSKAPDSVKTRTNNDLAIEAGNPFMKAVQAAHNYAQYEGMRTKSRDLRVFANPDVVYVLDAKSPGLSDALQIHIKDAVRGQIDHRNVLIDTANWIISKTPNAYLAFKILQTPKQYLATVNFAATKLPYKEFVKYYHEYYANRTAANELVHSSEAYQNRYRNFFRLLIGAAHKGDMSAVERHAYREALMSPLIFGDKLAVEPGMYAVYKYNLEVLKKSHEESMHQAEDALSLQGSGKVENLSNMSRDPSSKFLTVYMNQPNAMFVEQVLAVSDYIKHPSQETFNAAAKVVAVTHVSQALFASVDAAWKYGVGSLEHDEKKKQAALWDIQKAFLSGPGAFVLDTATGAVMTVLENQLTKELHKRFPKIEAQSEQVHTLSNIIADMGLHGIKLIQESLKETVKDPETGRWKNDYEPGDKALNMAIEYGRSLNIVMGALPIDPPLKFIKDVRGIKKAAEKRKRLGDSEE